MLWINGSLVTGDFGNLKRTPCGPSWQHCGFDRKVLKYNPILMTYPPPRFPKAKTLFEANIRTTRQYFESAAAAAK
jgi:hypothetical protein